MDLSLSSKEIHTIATEADSLISLLERGIDCTRQGAYVEGVALFTLARDQLIPGQEYFTGVFDAFLRSQASYWQAEQSLHLASKRFVEVDIERQAHLLALEKLLLTLHEETKISEEYQSQQLRQSPHLTPTDPHRSNDSDNKPLHSSLLPKNSDTLPDLYISCFGHFEVRRFDQPITLCHSRKGQTFLRFLVAQAGYRASADRLMDALWAQDSPDTARRKLQIAASAARGSLNSGYHCGPGEGYILCKDGVYQFNPSVTIRTDVDEFLSLWQAGQQTSGREATDLYERACNLCSGPFLVEDTYTDWSSARREQLKRIYKSMCRALVGYYLGVQLYESAEKWTNTILEEDCCDEAAHRQLIRIYIAQGRRSEALQQYHRCEHILSKELGVAPTPETMNALQAIQNSTDFPLARNSPMSATKIERK